MADGELDLVYWRDIQKNVNELCRRAEEHAAVDEILPSFALCWFSELTDWKAPLQVIQGLLTERSLFVVYGESNSGKTFFTLDLALSVACGTPWRGAPTRRGLVLYVAGEGAASVRARGLAYRIAHPEVSTGAPFAIIPQAVDFLNYDSVLSLIASVRNAESMSGEKCELLIIDTFARALPGADENSARDVGRAVAAADQIRVATGACVGFVHHAGKDPTKGARGSSALRAATDTEILIEGTTGVRTVTVSKQRDIEVCAPLSFELLPVAIGTDEQGGAVTSCVVKYTMTESTQANAPVVAQLRGRAQRQLLSALRERSKDTPNKIWTLLDLRQIGREMGLHRNSARQAVDALAVSPYLMPSVGGYRFTDGEGTH